MRRFSLLFALVLLFPSIGLAMPNTGAGGKAEKGPGPEEKFKKMDKNSDGSVSWDEFFEFYPNMHESAFKSIDKDGSRALTLEEWMNFSTRHTRDMDASGMGGAARGPVMREMFREDAPGGAQDGGQNAAPAQAPTDSKGRTLFEFKPKDGAE